MRWSTSWCLSSHGEFLGILSSNFAIFQSTQKTKTREQRGAITALYLDTLDIDTLVVLDRSLSICYYFRNLFKVLLGSCAHASFSPQSTHRSDGLHLLSSTFQYDPSRGRSARRLLLPFVSCHNWHGPLPAHYCLFLQGVSQNLGYFLSLASQPCQIWTIN